MNSLKYLKIKGERGEEGGEGGRERDNTTEWGWQITPSLATKDQQSIVNEADKEKNTNPARTEPETEKFISRHVNRRTNIDTPLI